MRYDVKNLIKNYEGVRLECKKATGGLPNSVWETYSAFANTHGGVILLGIEEKNKQLRTIGVSDAQEMIKNFWNIVNNPNKVSCNIMSDNNVCIENVDGLDVIVIDVPRANRHKKPIYIDGNFIKGTFRRNGEGDYRCTEEEIRNMIRDQVSQPLDAKILLNMKFDALDKDTIKKYRLRFKNMNTEHIWNELDDNEFLKVISAMDTAPEDGEEHPTIAGLLMFGHDYYITKEFGGYFLDYREKLDETQRWSDRLVSNSGDWSGNLFDFYFKIYSKITSDLKVPFKLNESMARIDDTPTHRAMREACANTLIHANYYGRRGIVIEKTNEMATFSNPGTLRISVEDAMKGGVSDPRNINLFKMFALIKIGERAGSGLYDISRTWESNGWEKPELIEEFDPDRIILKLKIYNKTSVETSVETSVKENNIRLNRSQKKILEYIKQNMDTTISDLALAINISERSVERNIKSLKEVGLVTRMGEKKNGVWRIND